MTRYRGGLVALAVAALGLLAFTANVQATETPEAKFFVCKYVGTPGVDETLQTGDNPISVSGNAIGGASVGQFFNDSQGRSFVLAEDVGQPEPSVAECPPPVGPPPHVFAASATCNPVTGEFDVGGSVDGLVALVSLLHIAGNTVGDTEITVTLGALVGKVIVHTAGDCVKTPPPPPPPVTPPPPPPHQVTGTATVICDLGAQTYRLSGTIDGQRADLVTPSTFPGNTKGTVNVIVTRGDTSFRTTVTLNGDCAPPTVTPPPPVVSVGVATPAPAKPVAPKPVVKPKPKPKPKPKVKPKPKKPTKHICVPLKNGTKRVWVPGRGCVTPKPPTGETLTG